MGLLQNISLKYAEPVDRMGDTSEMWPQQLSWQMNKYINQAGMSQKSGVPDGYSAPYAYSMPIKEGGLSSFVLIKGSGATSENSNLVMGKSFPVVTLTGSGGISSAAMALLVQLLADITASGEISNSSVLKAIANMESDVTGSGQIDTSLLALVAWCNAVLSGDGEASATMKGFADMSAEISATGEVLTAQQVASAVWAAIASDNNSSTTMGEKLNDAGGASNPWSVELPSEYTGNQAGKVLDDIKKKSNMIPGLY